MDSFANGAREMSAFAYDELGSRPRLGNAPALPDLLAQIPVGEKIVSVTADGIYDTKGCHSFLENIAPAEAGAKGPVADLKSRLNRWGELLAMDFAG